MWRKYRKVPLVNEAIKWDGDVQTLLALEKYDPEGEWFFMNGGLEINTLEGRQTVNIGDYIVKGAHGEFYARRGSIFEDTYEEVER